ncbi:MAG TPA: DNA polymerase III subunit delta' [Methylococcus sp.]|nr:DNA polymerase III subunit delta' [Methylococcus sp.]
MKADLTDRYPWLRAAWERLTGYLRLGRLPQGLLIAGTAGLGKSLLADAFARSLLCSAVEDHVACGACAACVLVEAASHPDYLRLEPDEGSKVITVDQVRRLIERLSLKPQYAHFRVVLIRPAHAMNPAAANSLLKTLEEPDPRTLMILLSEHPAQLPATIRSRCQRLDIALPTRERALQWLAQRGEGSRAEAALAMANGAPLRALELCHTDLAEWRNRMFRDWTALLHGEADPLFIAEQWAKEDGEIVIDWLQSWTVDLIRLRSAGNAAETRISNTDFEAGLRTLAGAIDLYALFKHLDLLHSARQSLAGQANRHLVLEELLIDWTESKAI